MVTQVATAVQQGAQNFRCVRVTDGTDTAAQSTAPNTTFSFTALYTGSLGNQVVLALNPGSQTSTWSLSVVLPGLQPEIYANIGGAGSAFWAALAAAVNLGEGPQRGPSQLVVASSGGTTVAPQAYRITLGVGIAGSDGATGVDASLLVGSNVSPRSGMYALQGQGCGIALLADADDSTQWSTQSAFGLQEGVYMVLTGPLAIQSRMRSVSKLRRALTATRQNSCSATGYGGLIKSTIWSIGIATGLRGRSPGEPFS